MIITKTIKLELESVTIRDKPLNRRGKYLSFEFCMFAPGPYSFFKRADFDGDFSVIWGQSPTIEFLKKNYKPVDLAVRDLIEKDLPAPFVRKNITDWRIRASYGEGTSPGKRKWGIFYDAACMNYDTRIRQSCDRHIALPPEFIDTLIAELPPMNWE